MILEDLEINCIKYQLKIIYEQRKSSSVSIRRGKINIRLPTAMSREEHKNQITKMKSWAIKKITEEPEKLAPKVKKSYKDGEILQIGDGKYLLNINSVEKTSSSAHLSNQNEINLYLSSKLNEEIRRNNISTLISRVIGQKKLPLLKEKIRALNKQHFQQQLGKIFFKNNLSNWGSCSKEGNINISTRLLFAPEDVLDYVCIHELAHLIEHNHSDRFWDLVEKAMPSYKEKVSWLKENGKICCF
ncbi:M48 family metallopeptidase [Candidatus Woesearchaeota archaeon]|nr:M48 family metallopeptidase [Candidatus Woesearchaeota archaeon]